MKLSPIASEISIVLDKPRKLILDFNAFAAYREVTGHELPDAIAGIFARDKKSGAVIKDSNGAPKVAHALTSAQMRALVWAGVAHEDDAPTLKKVGRHMGSTNHSDLMVAAFKSLYGVEDEAKDPTSTDAEKQSQSAGTGTESVPSAE